MIESATQTSGPSTRLHGWRLTIAALATPLAWFAQMFLGEMLTAQVCSLSTPERPGAPPSWMMPALLALSGACFVLGIAGVAVAWRTVVFTRTLHGEARDTRARRVAELEWFLARVSVLSSVMFLFGLIATDLAVLVVSPCGRW
jgi:hypothetical protein